MAIEIYTPTSEGKYLNFLIYGDPGVGKTTLAATATNVEEMCPVLFINVEGGTLSLIDAESVGITHPPDTVDITEWRELQQLGEFLQKSGHDYRTIIVDSLSELAKKNLDYIVDMSIRKDPDKDKNKGRETSDAYLEDYSKQSKHMRRVVQIFRDLNMHTILVSHAKLQKGDNGSELFVPSFGPELGKSINGMMDMVGAMIVIQNKEGKVTRRLVTQPLAGSRYFAKDRSAGQKLGGIIDNPTMEVIYKRIFNKPRELAEAK